MTCRDFLDEIVDERTARNPDFPAALEAAERRRELLVAQADLVRRDRRRPSLPMRSSGTRRAIGWLTYNADTMFRIALLYISIAIATAGLMLTLKAFDAGTVVTFAVLVLFAASVGAAIGCFGDRIPRLSRPRDAQHPPTL